uniref:RING-type domain-containing protein n=1 Tax=Ditylenchus dipsaci TaxID=166011 RepID=A0A915DEC3_9BILA
MSSLTIFRLRAHAPCVVATLGKLVCGNNVGCSKCVNQLFTTHTAKCPLCNAEWKRDPQDSGNTSLWTGHCPNRALAGILNQNNQPTCSTTPAIKPNPRPINPPKSLSKKFLHTSIQLQNSLESSSLLKEIRNKIEVESKCRICWELSIGPIICSVCGNNVGCSKCVNQLFTHINPTAKCPLCNAEWKRDPQDSGNTSLWTGHCPNRALAEILNQINQPTCSNLPTIKPSPMPTKPPKSAISTQSMTSNTPRIISSQKPHNPQSAVSLD